jgi:hypothetical protein
METGANSTPVIASAKRVAIHLDTRTDRHALFHALSRIKTILKA